MSPTSYQAAPPRGRILPQRPAVVKSLLRRVLLGLIPIENLVFLDHVEALARDALRKERVFRRARPGLLGPARLDREDLPSRAERRRLVLQRADSNEAAVPADERINEIAQHDARAPEKEPPLLAFLAGREPEKFPGRRILRALIRGSHHGCVRSPLTARPPFRVSRR